MFDIDRLAKLKFEHGRTQARLEYKPPKIDRKPVLYPTPNFADQLLELRTEPSAAVAVLAGNPAYAYYVPAWWTVHEKTIDQFRGVFTLRPTRRRASDPLYDQYALA